MADATTGAAALTNPAAAKIWGMDPGAFNQAMGIAGGLGAQLGGRGSIAEGANMVGGMVRQYNMSNYEADMKAYDTQEKQKADALKATERGNKYLESLGMTPAGVKGVTSQSVDKAGEITTTYTPEDVAAAAEQANSAQGMKAGDIDPSVYAGMELEDIKSSIALKNSINTSKMDAKYKKLLMEQMDQNMSMKRELHGGAKMLQGQSIEEGQQQALLNQVLQTSDGGMVTAGDLGKFILGEGESTTEVKTAQAMMDNPELSKQVTANKRASTITSDMRKQNKASDLTESRRSKLKSVEYDDSVKKKFGETREGSAIVRNMSSKDPAVKAAAKEAYANGINDTIYTDLSAEYGQVSTRMTIQGAKWFGIVDEQGNFKQIKRAQQ